jgi:hypothetical protein
VRRQLYWKGAMSGGASMKRLPKEAKRAGRRCSQAVRASAVSPRIRMPNAKLTRFKREISLAT